MYDVLRYHLGFLDTEFQPQRSDPGKRARPRLCLLACAAAGGDPVDAVPVATAIELLHNFTLIHDDIQDVSPTRRHRPAVWSRWGIGQAINAGDALFVIAHLALSRLTETVQPARVLELSTALHLTTLRIVEGQVLDLGFERRQDVTSAEYMRMIGGKTVAIYRYAGWAGALVAGATGERAALFGEFSDALGVGFQLQDDILGIWGDEAQTGKRANDIQQRKKTFPILVLRERASVTDRTSIDQLFSQDHLTEDEIERIQTLLARYDVLPATQAHVEHWHDRAYELLSALQPQEPAGDQLAALVEKLASRAS